MGVLLSGREVKLEKIFQFWKTERLMNDISPQRDRGRPKVQLIKAVPHECKKGKF